jgi:hypothetical protein
LHGTVKKVGQMPDMEGRWGPRGEAKEFEVILSIDDLPQGIGFKPGFSAEVKIEVGRVPAVLTVPVQAVGERGGKHYAYVSTPNGVEPTEVTVGESNEKYVEIRFGLEEGQAVCLDARKRCNADAQAEGRSSPALEAKKSQVAP